MKHTNNIQFRDHIELLSIFYYLLTNISELVSLNKLLPLPFEYLNLNEAEMYLICSKHLLIEPASELVVAFYDIHDNHLYISILFCSYELYHVICCKDSDAICDLVCLPRMNYLNLNLSDYLMPPQLLEYLNNIVMFE